MSHSLPAKLRIACDSLAALGNATADGAVLFAKNSDRNPDECQPLVQVPRRSHPLGSRVRCTYVETPQVAETAAVIGSRPFWTWGFEHGLNEHGVAIGNNFVFCKDALNSPGLIGTDLVRLGLERSRSAIHAVEIMTALIERYGQGGSGYHDMDLAYHNSFLVADRTTAFTVETSDRHWATRQVEDIGSVSNHLSIGSDWDALSDGCIEHAIAHGWWDDDREERFDFAAAYRDTSGLAEWISSHRHQRTCTLLEERKGNITVDAIKGILRDHYGRPLPPTDLSRQDAHYFSVCMHQADPVGTTTASMIARIPSATDTPLTYWASFGSPCLSVFIPLYVDADIPEVLSRGGEHPSDDSPWWQFKRLLTLVERDWTHAAPRVRAAFDALETDIAARMRDLRIDTRPPAERTAFMRSTVSEVLTSLDRLTAELEGR